MIATPASGAGRVPALVLPFAVLLGSLAGAPEASSDEPTARGRTAPEWIEIMGGESGEAAAVGALKEIGAPSLPHLLKALETSPNPKVRRGASRALGLVGGPGTAAALVTAIGREPNSDVALAAVYSLAMLIRNGDAQAAAEKPGAIRALVTGLTAPDIRGGLSGAALGLLGPEAARELVAVAANHPNAAARSRAIFGLRTAEGEGIEETLTRTLGDQSVEVRRAGAEAIARRAARPPAQAPPLDMAVPALIQALKDADSLVRANAAGALQKIGPGARSALPALRAAREDSNSYAAEAATKAVAALEAIPATVLPPVVPSPPTSAATAGPTKIVQGRPLEEWVRLYCSNDKDAQAGVVVRQAGAEAVPALRTIATSDPEGRVRSRAVAVLAHRGGAGAAAALAVVARADRDDNVRQNAAVGLNDLAAGGDAEAQKLAEALIPELIAALAKDPDPRGVPVGSLGRMGATATPALMQAANHHPAANARAGALYALKWTQNQKAAPVVVRAFKDESASVRLASIAAVAWLVGPGSPEFEQTVSGLVTLLKDPDVKVKCAAAHMLGDLGPQARSALPALREAAERDASVRYYAENAIKELQ